MKRTLTDKALWGMVKSLRWGELLSDEKCGKILLDTYQMEAARELRAFVGQKQSELQDAVLKYEEEHGELYVGSDDGFSDVTAHIVGLGQKEWEKNMKNPTLVEKRYSKDYGTKDSYKESFLYTFHVIPNGASEPEPEDERLSNCCGEKVQGQYHSVKEGYIPIGICRGCKEHAAFLTDEESEALDRLHRGKAYGE